MSSLADLIQFVERVVAVANVFSSAVFDFMTYNVAIWDVTVFEILLGGGVAVYLTTAISKWLIGVIT